MTDTLVDTRSQKRIHFEMDWALIELTHNLLGLQLECTAGGG